MGYTRLLFAVAACLSLFAGLVEGWTDCVAVSGDPVCKDLSTLGSSCWFNWQRDNKCPGSDYMYQWDGPGTTGDLPWSSARTVCAHNEPNIKKQYVRWAAQISPGEACSQWKKVAGKVKGTRVSPGVAYCTHAWYSRKAFYYPGCSYGHTDWLRDFYNAGCRNLVDKTAAHIYDCDIGKVKKYVDELRSLGKPVWITEISCQEHTTWGNIKLLRDLMKKNSVNVERVYWVQTRSNGDANSKASKLIWKGALSDVGKQWKHSYFNGKSDSKYRYLNNKG